MTLRKQIDEAADCVRRGGVLLYPTATVYGLGGDPTCNSAVQRIRDLKGRAADKPMLVLTDRWERVEPWISDLSRLHRKLMQNAPPLPLTILFDTDAEELINVRAGRPQIGIRCTSDPFCRSVIEMADCPLISTSANRSGEPAPRRFEETDPELLRGVDLAIDAGSSLGGQPSTVVAVENESLIILREGAVSEDQLHEIIQT